MGPECGVWRGCRAGGELAAFWVALWVLRRLIQGTRCMSERWIGVLYVVQINQMLYSKRINYYDRIRNASTKCSRVGSFLIHLSSEASELKPIYI
jgi:hypothetical protein